MLLACGKARYAKCDQIPPPSSEQDTSLKTANNYADILELQERKWQDHEGNVKFHVVFLQGPRAFGGLAASIIATTSSISISLSVKPAACGRVRTQILGDISSPSQRLLLPSLMKLAWMTMGVTSSGAACVQILPVTRTCRPKYSLSSPSVTILPVI